MSARHPIALAADGALAFLFASVCDAMIVCGAIESLEGRPVRAGESIVRGLRRALPVSAVSLLAMLITVLGLILLVVPGVIAAVILSVAVPACVVERLGPIESLRRSDDLTGGFRWRIFAALVAFSVATWAVNGVVGAVDPLLPGWLRFGVEGAWTAIGVGASAVLSAVIYHDLRRAKDPAGA